MPSPAINAQTPKWAGPVRGFGILSILGALVFFVVGGLRAYQRHTETAVWPAVAAQVKECHLNSYHHIRSNSRGGTHLQGTQNQVRCTFQYDVSGSSYEESKDAGSSAFYSDKEIILVPPKVTLAKLNKWIRLHPKGSTQTIHYNSTDPRQLSLAGADDDIQENTADIPLKTAAAFLVVGLIFLFASVVASQKNASVVTQS
jgi:hypothetical protein